MKPLEVLSNKSYVHMISGLLLSAIAILAIWAALDINNERSFHNCKDLLAISKTREDSLAVYISKQTEKVIPIISDNPNCYDVTHTKTGASK